MCEFTGLFKSDISLSRTFHNETREGYKNKALMKYKIYKTLHSQII